MLCLLDPPYRVVPFVLFEDKNRRRHLQREESWVVVDLWTCGLVTGIVFFVLCPNLLSMPIRACRATERSELSREMRGEERRGEERRGEERGC
jgi:hypothetical protein